MKFRSAISVLFLALGLSTQAFAHSAARGSAVVGVSAKALYEVLEAKSGNGFSCAPSREYGFECRFETGVVVEGDTMSFVVNAGDRVNRVARAVFLALPSYLSEVAAQDELEVLVVKRVDKFMVTLATDKLSGEQTYRLEYSLR